MLKYSKPSIPKMQLVFLIVFSSISSLAVPPTAARQLTRKETIHATNKLRNHLSRTLPIKGVPVIYKPKPLIDEMLLGGAVVGGSFAAGALIA
jgi:hypothetical protein